MNKLTIHTTLLSGINDKIEALRKELQDLVEDLERESKSSAGDKHETSTAMMHLEQERLNGRLIPLLEMIRSLELPENIRMQHDAIRSGSLVNLDGEHYYLSVAFGKIESDGESIFCLSPSSPLGTELLGKKAGESVIFNGKERKIVSVK